MKVIQPIAELAGVDVFEKSKEFSVPEKIRGLIPVPFYNISMKNLAWLWDTKDPKDMLLAIVEIFFYSGRPWWCKRIFKDSEKWSKRWLMGAPLIDFYRFAYEIIEQTKQAAEQFSKMQINLSDEEKEAGYGQPDPESVQKLIDAFARRMGINSLEAAADYPWTHYRFVFKSDVDEQNRQRKLNIIIAEKQKKKNKGR